MLEHSIFQTEVQFNAPTQLFSSESVVKDLAKACGTEGIGKMSTISSKKTTHRYYSGGRQKADTRWTYTVRNWQQTGSGETWLIGKSNTTHDTHEGAIDEAKTWSPFIWSNHTNKNHSTTSTAQTEQKCSTSGRSSGSNKSKSKKKSKKTSWRSRLKTLRRKYKW